MTPESLLGEIDDVLGAKWTAMRDEHDQAELTAIGLACYRLALKHATAKAILRAPCNESGGDGMATCAHSIRDLDAIAAAAEKLP